MACTVPPPHYSTSSCEHQHQASERGPFFYPQGFQKTYLEYTVVISHISLMDTVMNSP